MLEELFIIADAMAEVRPGSDESKMLAGRKQEEEGELGQAKIRLVFIYKKLFFVFFLGTAAMAMIALPFVVFCSCAVD